MSAEVDAYQAALRAMQGAEKEADKVARIIRNAGSALANWKQVVVSNVSGIGFPTELIIGSNDQSINASEWPTALKLSQALAAYHTARHEAQSAFARLTPEQRTGLGPPG
jgi:hypothetical protein